MGNQYILLTVSSIFQAKKLEANIEITKKEMEEPTEVETELKQRLGQMTDHLIQKQAQVCLQTSWINLVGDFLYLFLFDEWGPLDFVKCPHI